MKTCLFSRSGGQLTIWLVAILASAAKIFSQTTDSNLVPIVTVNASQPIATLTNSGVFTLLRAGNTNLALNVWYDLGGTASNGVDYVMIPPHQLTIDAGAISNTILITPFTNPPSAGTAKRVVLTLTNSPLMTPVNYQIGAPSQAVVYLETGVASNLPPVVNLFEPTNSETFFAPTNILMLAKAGDPDGSVTNVEFFAGTNDLGSGSPVVLDPPGVNGLTGLVYLFSWHNPPAASNVPLSAVATDNGGLSTTSAPVNITVLQGPLTNLPPVVRIVSPPNGAVFRAPVNLPLYAYAADPDGDVAAVQFLAGTNNLGFAQRLPVVEPLAGGGLVVVGPVPPIYPTNLFFLIWTNAPVGTNILTAVATDNGGLSSTSPPVNITILPPLPPTTNRPPIVSIVATDPVAIEGTNCWVWPGETNSPPTWAAWPTAVCRSFTNCGPKTATFTVRRFGDTNDDLTVPYDIGGTASNGVDYVALTGSVTIPAGERRAFITVVPIDDGPPDVNKTVILTLTASSNAPPDYLLGFPRCAAALIIDHGLCPATGVLPGGCFHLAEPGPDGAWFYIQCSTDLVNWASICTNQVINGSVDFVDPDATKNPSFFYRAVPLNGPPLE